jgi:hypothetical protein
MPKVELIETSEPASDESAMIPQTAGSLLISLAFWMSLLIAATMYAAVALSPKLADWINVRQQYLSNAMRLQELEDEADYLERVAAALKSDPEFAGHLVRAHQNVGQNDSEFVPVSHDLLFGGSVRKTYDEPVVVQPAVASLVYHLASHEQHRYWLLAAAAGLTLTAFTLMNEAGAGMLTACLRTGVRIFTAVTQRYRKPAPEPALIDAMPDSDTE